MFSHCSQYDNRAKDLTKEGMLKGIEDAAAFILFLSSGVLERPYCQMEIREAVALKKPIVLVHGKQREGASHIAHSNLKLCLLCRRERCQIRWL